MILPFGTEKGGRNTENRGARNIESFSNANVQYFFRDWAKVVAKSRWSQYRGGRKARLHCIIYMGHHATR